MALVNGDDRLFHLKIKIKQKLTHTQSTASLQEKKIQFSLLLLNFLLFYCAIKTAESRDKNE